eukprot:Lankesteria_metandrocarpae@DN8920_c0_g1_i1.p1
MALHSAHTTARNYRLCYDKVNMEIRDYAEEVRLLEDQVAQSTNKVTDIRDDIELTNQNYSQQISILSEHVCALESDLLDKVSKLRDFNSKNLLCAHCGTWQSIGTLTSSSAACQGRCSNCKADVLRSSNYEE